jgi:hypothetical protein
MMMTLYTGNAAAKMVRRLCRRDVRGQGEVWQAFTVQRSTSVGYILSLSSLEVHPPVFRPIPAAAPILVKFL